MLPAVRRWISVQFADCFISVPVRIDGVAGSDFGMHAGGGRSINIASQVWMLDRSYRNVARVLALDRLLIRGSHHWLAFSVGRWGKRREVVIPPLVSSQKYYECTLLDVRADV